MQGAGVLPQKKKRIIFCNVRSYFSFSAGTDDANENCMETGKMMKRTVAGSFLIGLAVVMLGCPTSAVPSQFQVIMLSAALNVMTTTEIGPEAPIFFTKQAPMHGIQVKNSLLSMPPPMMPVQIPAAHCLQQTVTASSALVGIMNSDIKPGRFILCRINDE